MAWLKVPLASPVVRNVVRNSKRWSFGCSFKLPVFSLFPVNFKLVLALESTVHWIPVVVDKVADVLEVPEVLSLI